MKASNLQNDNNIVQTLNLGTNILTVILFIAYSVAKRIEVDEYIIYLLCTLFIINSVFSIYLFYRNNKERRVGFRRINTWIIVRIIANIGFAILTFYLIK